MIVTIDSGWRTASITPGAPLSAPKRPCTATSPSGETLLSMKLLVLPVIVHGVADLAIHMDVAQSIEDLDDLAMPPAPTLQEGEPDPLAEHRRVGNRGDITLIVFERRLVAAIEEVRARPE